MSVSSPKHVASSAPQPEVWIQLLGEFRVVIPESTEQPQKFRSRTAERLLASLALRLGRSVSKSELLESLWPDSDGDRQAQNLRRALSDIRQVLVDGSIVFAQGDRLGLDATRVQTDVEQFKRLTDAGLEGSNAEKNLLEAIQLYVGPLLADRDEHWLQVHRMELEERFGQAVEQMITLLLRAERHDEALRLGRQAVISAPLREDVHMALTSAYASAGLKSEAIRQFEELESLLGEQWGETPSAKSVRAFEALWKPSESSAASQEGTTGGGAMQVGSRFYIARECDKALRQAAVRNEGTILVHGPRQVGKTSLLYRTLNELKTTKTVVAITDFQVLSKTQLANADAFCKALAYGFGAQLGVRLDIGAIWNEWIGPNSNLHAAVESVLRQANGQVVWAMDEADRLFGSEFADDFFGLVRSWHNLRAMEAGGPFGRLSLVISYATEAHLFIQDINQSPFNVGVRVAVQDFDEHHITELASRYGLALTNIDIARIKQLTGGQPFLTRRIFDALIHDGTPLDSVEARVAGDDGLFGDHLRRLLTVTCKDDSTKSEVVRFLSGQQFVDPKTPLRLTAGGMLIRRPDSQYEFRVPAYREYLSRYLLSPA